MNVISLSARRAASARTAARKAGLQTYLGQPCSRGHHGRRHVSCGNCVACLAERAAQLKADQRARWRNAILAKIYPDEFDRRGWRRISNAS